MATRRPYGTRASAVHAGQASRCGFSVLSCCRCSRLMLRRVSPRGEPADGSTRVIPNRPRSSRGAVVERLRTVDYRRGRPTAFASRQ